MTSSTATGSPDAGAAFAIREAAPDELTAIADLVNRAEPWRVLPMAVGDIELAATQVVPGGIDARLVATAGDAPGSPIVGHGWLRDDGFPRDAYYLQLRVDPAHRRHGLGTRILDELVARAAPGKREIAAFTSELSTETAAFAAARGFEERYRLIGWRIDPSTFDPAAYPLRPLPAGVRITTLAEVDSPALRRGLYELGEEVAVDVPSPDPFPPSTYEEWERFTFDGPRYRPETHLIAVDRDRPVGECWLEVDGASAWIHFTAVGRSHRGLGIAMHLKVASLVLMRRLGVSELRTENHTNNAGMLAMNERLGFERRPGFIRFGRDL